VQKSSSIKLEKKADEDPEKVSEKAMSNKLSKKYLNLDLT
jgi:hypothetical protein